MVQVLDVTTSVGSPLPLPLEACVVGAGSVTPPEACTVVAQGQGGAAASSSEGWLLDFKPAPDPSCTISRVQLGLCWACTATAAAEGQCAAGLHTFVVDAVSPDGLHTEEMLGLTLHVGASLISGDVRAQIEVIADTRGLVAGDADTAFARMQHMLVSTQVRGLEMHSSWTSE